jgi:hypothetical protein
VSSDPAFNRYQPSHPEYVGKEIRPARRCGWHYLTSTVNCDGTVAPCCTLYEKQDDFGQLDYRQNDSYMQVLNNEKFRSVRVRFASRVTSRWALCEKCPTPSMMRNAADQSPDRDAGDQIAQAASGCSPLAPGPGPAATTSHEPNAGSRSAGMVAGLLLQHIPLTVCVEEDSHSTG